MNVWTFRLFGFRYVTQTGLTLMSTQNLKRIRDFNSSKINSTGPLNLISNVDVQVTSLN